MKRILATIAILTPMAAMAAGPVPLGPNKGTFGDWTAASYGSGKTKVCYAFTKPQTTRPAFAGRGLAMLTVTERHGSRDEISLTPGFTYPSKAVVGMQVGPQKIGFYVQDNVAFTDTVSKALDGFSKGAQANVTFTGPHSRKYTDAFSLTGFSAAYKAILQACP